MKRNKIVLNIKNSFIIIMLSASPTFSGEGGRDDENPKKNVEVFTVSEKISNLRIDIKGCKIEANAIKIELKDIATDIKVADKIRTDFQRLADKRKAQRNFLEKENSLLKKELRSGKTDSGELTDSLRRRNEQNIRVNEKEIVRLKEGAKRSRPLITDQEKILRKKKVEHRKLRAKHSKILRKCDHLREQLAKAKGK